MASLTVMLWPRNLCRLFQLHFFVVFIVSRAGFAGAALDRVIETKGVCIQFPELETLTKHANRLMRGLNTRKIARESMVCIFFLHVIFHF